MKDEWAVEFWRLAGVLLFGIALALISGFTTASLLIALGVYIAWNMEQLQRINNWLAKGSQRSQLPEVHGPWNNLVKEIFITRSKLHKRSRRLSQVLKRFRRSSAVLPDATIILTESGKIDWFSPAAQNLIGLKKPQDVHQNIRNLIRHPTFQTYLNHAHYERGQEVNIPSPEHPSITLNIRITPFGRNELLLSARDVTSMQKVQDVRRDFVANVSHELRTPLTVITGYTETLGDENLPDDIQIGISAISQQAKRMTQIVEDLLMLSSLEMETSEAQTEREIVQVPLMLESMCEDAILLSGDAKHHVHLDVQSNSCLLGHQSDIVSAFRNLIDNAICHTPPGSTVFIRWDTVNGNARLSVQDNGLGIDEKHIPRLTERFYRVDKGRSRDMGGTGLGLSIAKHAIQRNGGELTITSQRGKGSTFKCTCPAEQVYTPELEQPGLEAQA